METTIENSIFTVERRMNFFPPPPLFPEPPTTPTTLPLYAFKDKWQGSSFSVVIRALRLLKQH
jgi:hypothetical protein